MSSSLSKNNVEEEIMFENEKEIAIMDESTGHSDKLEITAATVEEEEPTDDRNGFFERQAKAVARNPCIYLWVALIVSFAMSAIAIIVGEFTIEAESNGWTTRGTVIADRQSQSILVRNYQWDLLHGGEEAWERLTNNIQQPRWETEEESEDGGDGDDGRRRLSADSLRDVILPKSDILYLENDQKQRHLPFVMNNVMKRRLQEQSGILEGCDTTLYTSESFASDPRLWPVWKSQSKSTSLLSPEALRDICVAEENTQRRLEEQGLCFGCDEGCLPPYSIVLYARLMVSDGLGMSCEELRDAWDPYQAATEEQWKECVEELKATYEPTTTVALPESCPWSFSTHMADGTFDESMVLTYTSSIFATESWEATDLYERVEDFDLGSNLVKGTYDTQYQQFVAEYESDALSSDFALGMGSAIVVIVAIMTHTRSPLITLMGLLQIVLSFPLAFFVYKLVAGLKFFPFLNFIGIFVVFALGADDVFVAVDKWKNARLDYPKASTEFIAAVALPDAAGAMFLTTLTTSIAFFATSICPVAPVKMFAIFCGLLIMLDYIMCVLLIFPTLCIYDKALQAGRANCCISISCCRRNQPQGEGDEIDETTEEKPSLIRRILFGYYNLLHKARWGLFIICFAALAVSAYYATTLDLPVTLDVRLLDETNQFEQNYRWRQKLLNDVLVKSAGSNAYAFWGITPADTGDHLNPDSFTQLVLDDSFDPSAEEAQIFVMEMCDDLYEQEFASLPDANYTCPMKGLDQWLKDQQDQTSMFLEEIYTENCGGATQVPVPKESFHACMSAWARGVDEQWVFTRNNTVKILVMPFGIRVGYNEEFRKLNDEYSLIEEWMNGQMEDAPTGVNQGYFIGRDFWWYDTHKAMLETAYSSATISLIASSLVILLSSRSVALTVFAAATIVYVLASVTATMVAFGWTLGFLESICFAILIGLSADFVTHFSHSYASLSGSVDRGARTKHALIHMGPSILAASMTTVAAAIIMIFTIIVFFQKFAYVLFFSIIQATAAAFIFFCTMTDCLGPSDPTYLFDSIVSCIFCRKKNEQGARAQDSDKTASAVNSKAPE